LRTVQAVCLRCPALTVQTRSAHSQVASCIRMVLGAFLESADAPEPGWVFLRARQPEI